MGRKRTYRREDQTTRESLIKNMIQKRGCDIGNGRIPQTLIPVTVKETGEDTSGIVRTGTALQPVQEFKASDDQKRSTSQDFPGKNQEKSKLGEGVLRQGTQFDNDVVTEVSGKVSNCAIHIGDISNNTWSRFQPRPSKEPVRNCASLEKSLKEFIVNTVARKLLGSPLVGDSDANVTAVSRTDSQVTSGVCTSNWRTGGGWDGCAVFVARLKVRLLLVVFA